MGKARGEADQSPTAYTAADFDRVLAEIDRLGVEDDVLVAALRIASRVVEPGVIEAECNKPFEPASACLSTTELAACIRTALTKDIR